MLGDDCCVPCSLPLLTCSARSQPSDAQLIMWSTISKQGVLICLPMQGQPKTLLDSPAWETWHSQPQPEASPSPAAGDALQELLAVLCIRCDVCNTPCVST